MLERWTILLLLFTLTASVAAEDFNYTTNNGAIIITKYTGPGGHVDIPSEINGLPVISIGDGVFYCCWSLTSVTIPDSVTTIGADGFCECLALTNVAIGNGVTTIGGYAFRDCVSLTSVIIGNGVTTIEDWAFSGCTSLTNVVIPDSVTVIGWAAFYDCLHLTTVTMGKSVTTIGVGAFFSCYVLTGVHFRGNAPSLTIPYSPYSQVFEGTSATIYYLPGTTGWDSTFDGRPTMLWNPRIQTNGLSFGVGSHGFGFTITGTTNIPIVLEASPALRGATWIQLLNCTLTNGSLYFSDPARTNHLVRFYRIRPP